MFCQLLVLSDVNIFQAAQKGDGYRAGPSPHSPNESFQGVTLLKAVKVCLLPLPKNLSLIKITFDDSEIKFKCHIL